MPVATHAEPSFGALHLSIPDLIEHFVTPLALVRQQVTKSGLPQVERAAQLLTGPPQLRFSKPAPFTASATQLTYLPWLSNATQSQVAAAAFAAVMSAASATGSPFAALRCAVSASSDSAIAVTKKPRILGLIGHLPFGFVVVHICPRLASGQPGNSCSGTPSRRGVIFSSTNAPILV